MNEMDIKDLRKAWNSLTAKSSEQRMLNEEQIRSMLGRRTTTLLDRIDRNVRIGLILLLAVVVVLGVAEFLPLMVRNSGEPLTGEIPAWLRTIDLGVSLLIITLFIAFSLHYRKMRNTCRQVCDLRHTLMKIIGVLTLYRRLFGLALIIILLESGTGFTAGFFTSVTQNHTLEGFFIPTLVMGLLLILLITGFLFLLLRWAFRKVYGNYLDQLRATLAELDDLPKETNHPQE